MALATEQAILASNEQETDSSSYPENELFNLDHLLSQNSEKEWQDENQPVFNVTISEQQTCRFLHYSEH